MTARPTPDETQEIANAVLSGNTMEAIRLYRETTGNGLEEAKDFIEALKARLPPDQKTQPSTQKMHIGVVVFLGLLTLGAGVALIFASIRAMSLGKESEHWPSTQGTINLVQAGNRSRGRSARITYSYTVDGQSYHSATYTYRYSSPDALPIGQYHRGQDVVVYYKPSKPEIAVLLPGFEPHILRPLVGLVFLLITGYLAKRGIREHKVRSSVLHKEMK